MGRLVVIFILAANACIAAALLCSAYSQYVRPDEHPYFSCLGLAFPVFAIINLCFLLFWLVVRCYRAALLPAVVFLLCAPQLRVYCPLNFWKEEAPPGSIKVLSYNVMGLSGSVDSKGRNTILEYLKDSNADVLCLQEFWTGAASGDLSRKTVERELAALYPYHHITTLGKSKSNNMACFSKFPILSANTISYESGYNGSVMYELEIEKDTLTLINNHLESNKLTKEDKIVYENMLSDPEKDNVKNGLRILLSKLAEASAIRAVQADSIARRIASSPYPYILVCGDFNDTPLSYAHRVISHGLDDAFVSSGCGLGISYNQNKFYFRIDNILTSKALKTYACVVDRSIKTSDHYPIWCIVAKRDL